MFSLIFICGCSTDIKEPKKNENIPIDAKWVGGTDGGVWYSLSDTLGTYNYIIKVYNEHDGSLWVKGIFSLDTNCNFDSTYFLSDESILAWDGINFIIKNPKSEDKNCLLSPISYSK